MPEKEKCRFLLFSLAAGRRLGVFHYSGITFSLARATKYKIQNTKLQNTAVRHGVRPPTLHFLPRAFVVSL